MIPVTGEVLTFFLLAAGPALLFMGVWSAVMGARLLFPERPLPLLDLGPWAARWEQSGPPQARLHQIQAEVRRQAQHLGLPAGVLLEDAPGLHTVSWQQDLQERRN